MPKKSSKKKPKIKKAQKTPKIKKVKIKFRAVNFLAPEFLYYKKGAGWYLALISAGLIIIGIAIWQKMWFLGAIILLSLIVFLQYSKMRPQSKKCHISLYHIKINDKIFPIEWFKSFSLIYDKPHSHLFLETAKRLSTSFWLHVKMKDLKRVRDSLLAILPEKPVQESFMVKINRWIKF